MPTIPDDVFLISCFLQDLPSVVSAHMRSNLKAADTLNCAQELATIHAGSTGSSLHWAYTCVGHTSAIHSNGPQCTSYTTAPHVGRTAMMHQCQPLCCVWPRRPLARRPPVPCLREKTSPRPTPTTPATRTKYTQSHKWRTRQVQHH